MSENRLYDRMTGRVSEDETRLVIAGIAGLLQIYVMGLETPQDITARLEAEELADFADLIAHLDGLADRAEKERCLAAWQRLVTCAEWSQRTDAPVIPDSATLKTLMLGWVP